MRTAQGFLAGAAAGALLGGALVAAWPRPREAGPGSLNGGEPRPAGRPAAAGAEGRQKVLALAGEVRRLLVSLAGARAEADAWRARAERAEPAAARADTAAGRPTAYAATVLDYNGGLRLVVLNAGRTAGVRPGLGYQLYRDGEWVARVRATDVRERIAGARVEEVRPGGVPRPGDRAVLGGKAR